MDCSRLENFSKIGLGLEVNEVRLVAHHPKWKRIYSDEAYQILQALNIDSLRLYHCGSTADSYLFRYGSNRNLL